MIYVRKLKLETFKGINSLECEFDDLTVLAGLNNSGKTTVLQAIYLLLSTVPAIASHANLGHREHRKRQVDMNPGISRLGLVGVDRLLQGQANSMGFEVTAEFWNDCSITIGMRPHEALYYRADAPDLPSPVEEATEKLRTLLTAVAESVKSEFFRPPGLVSPVETMLELGNYHSQVASGQGGTVWRNGIWWQLQQNRIESFEPVKDLIEEHFPGLTLFLPRLGGNNRIEIEYQEPGRRALDISQSGAGLHTFLSLAQLIRQSGATLLLLDEPDSHLHASQQARVMELLTTFATTEGKQVIVATHAPEILMRLPESVRWLDKQSSEAEGGIDTVELIRRLGATIDTYLNASELPKIFVYVEGDDDKRTIEALIDWCRRHGGESLSTTKVIRHKDGKFDAVALQAIQRFLKEGHHSARVVGIRDLDWDYGSLPAETLLIEDGDGYTLVTLPCKELENLLCNADLLSDALDEKVSRRIVANLLEEESNAEPLINEWHDNVAPRIRNQLGSKLADNTREAEARRLFDEWKSDPVIRARLVAGKGLLARVRHRLKTEHKTSAGHSSHLLGQVKQLSRAFEQLAAVIFPSYLPPGTQI